MTSCPTSRVYYRTLVLVMRRRYVVVVSDNRAQGQPLDSRPGPSDHRRRSVSTLSPDNIEGPERPAKKTRAIAQVRATSSGEVCYAASSS